MDKEKSVYVKSIKSYFMDYQEPKEKLRKLTSSGFFKAGVGYSVPKISDPKYPFREKVWTHGIITSLKSLTPDEIRLDLNSDGTGKLVSILPSRNERIIIHNIEIKQNSNAWEHHKNFIKFSLLRVKKNIHTSNVGQTNNLTNKSFIASDNLQLMERDSFVCGNILLTDLNYDLSIEDDLILIEKIEIDRGGGGIRTEFSALNTIVYYAGLANTLYSNYDVVLHYSHGEI